MLGRWGGEGGLEFADPLLKFKVLNGKVSMKKFATLVLFVLLATAGFSQLAVVGSHDGQKFQVEFAAGPGVEYKVLMVDPINPGSLELQKGYLDQDHRTVEWTADLRYVYEIHYRPVTPTGELSEWIVLDPKSLLHSESR
jgi:hypothetical protein